MLQISALNPSPQVERLRSMVKKLQRDRQSKDADLAALKAPAVVPKNFCVELRVRGVVLDDAGEESQGVWCLVRPTMPAVPEVRARGRSRTDDSARFEALTICAYSAVSRRPSFLEGVVHWKTHVSSDLVSRDFNHDKNKLR